jgi:hypothetical protein
METMHEQAVISSQFEPCAKFGPASAGEPVCACGWLDTEHEQPVAEVRTLPRPRAARPAPKRLAS